MITEVEMTEYLQGYGDQQKIQEWADNEEPGLLAGLLFDNEYISTKTGSKRNCHLDNAVDLLTKIFNRLPYTAQAYASKVFIGNQAYTYIKALLRSNLDDLTRTNNIHEAVRTNIEHAEVIQDILGTLQYYAGSYFHD